MGATPQTPTGPNDELQRVLDFVRDQTSVEIQNIERLFNRAKTMFGWILIAAGVVLVFLGFSTYLSLQNLVTNLVGDGLKHQVPAQIEDQLKKEKIESTIESILRKKTETQFQQAIDTAVASQIDTPQRQKLLESAIQRQVDAWFPQHQQILRAASQRQVDMLTEHLQAREKVLQRGDAAITSSVKSGPALAELRRLYKASSNESIGVAARAELARVRSFWGSATYLKPSDQITRVNGKPVVPSALTTCEFLVLLHSDSWTDRARSAEWLAGREQKGVVEALMAVMEKDDYVDVQTHAFRALQVTTSEAGELEVLPDSDDLHRWWAKVGPTVAAKFKPNGCN